MSDWQPIETAPTRPGTKILVWLPKFNTVDVAQCVVQEAYGMDIVEWVDQWNNDPYETSDGSWAGPTHWKPLDEPPSETL